MIKIYLVGASHGRRTSEALKRLPGYGVDFQVFCFCVGGKKFYDLAWPNLDLLTTQDVLVVFPFGNDLVDRKFIKKDQKTRKIHL